MDPFHHDTEAREVAHQLNITYQAYSSLGTQWVWHRGFRENPIEKEHALLQILEETTRTKFPGCDDTPCGRIRSIQEVILLWQLQLEVSVIPASTNATRIQHNRELML